MMSNKTFISEERITERAKATLVLCFSSFVLLIAIVAFGKLFASPSIAFASAVEDAEKSRFENDLLQSLKAKVSSDLSKFCPDGCSLLGIEVDGREIFDTNSSSLGFETSLPVNRKFAVRRAQIEILVDNRIGAVNIERLQEVLTRSSKKYGVPVEIELTRTTLPDSPQLVRAEAESKRIALGVVKAAYEKVVSDFCPEDCRLNTVEINTSRISVDDAQNQPARRVVVIAESKWALLVQGSVVNMAVDEKMAESRRNQIEDMMRDTMEAFGSGELNVKRTAFPRSARQLEKEAEDLRSDPWGLEKLGRALKVFREFANTKEIIKERESLSSSRESERNKEFNSERNSESRESQDKLRETTQSQSQIQSERENTHSENLSSFWTQEKVLLVAGLIGLLLLVAALGLRYVLTGKQVQHLISEGRGSLSDDLSSMQDDSLFDPSMIGNAHKAERAPPHSLHSNVPAQVGGARVVPGFSMGLSEELAQRLNVQSLRDELTQAFITQPKLAREVFARILREDGVEFSAKCVSVFGEMIVFDLAGDDDLKKEVALLAEYIHVSTPFVSDAEQLAVLRGLKLKLTAGKMRLLTHTMQDAFDFLRSQSARQIYNLIADESARSQAVVLTQLTTEKRRAVYELFDGPLKSELLKELCVKDTLSREYLQNVADALKRKLHHSGSLQGEVLGGADVIIDLMERSDRVDQAAMMLDMDKNNSDLARQIRSRLVTVESLAYLSDGLLLEIFLSMEPQAMVVFLAGVRENVRNMVLSKAPDEVAADWTASASSVRGIDPETFRLAEMQVLGKVRAFAANGLINLAEINEIMFPIRAMEPGQATTAEQPSRIPLSSLVVA